MKCYIGLGSNLLDKKKNLENAVTQLIQDKSLRLLRVSPVVETPALVPAEAPDDWQKSFLNAVIEISWDGTALDLLRLLKRTEQKLGREPSLRWAPRIIDLDLLTFGDVIFQDNDLVTPHPEMWNRQFVLGCLKHLRPKYQQDQQTVLRRSRELESPLPQWMAILNLTPDSFSDGSTSRDPESFGQLVERLRDENIGLLDLGAESTRPHAKPLTPEEEWERLEPALEIVKAKLHGHFFHPKISIDTYHPTTARRALDYGIDIINDVSGLKDPVMLDVLKDTDCDYVLMHSLTVPADPKIHLQGNNPAAQIKEWAWRKLEHLHENGIDLDRIIFDPGVGFGKTATQSLAVLKEIHQFMDLPVRILVGHSRKSFLNQGRPRPATDRDFETLGISLGLATKGVDILRVHAAELHQRTFHALRGMS